jgi:7-keto-8-aminopelargonate synthetase-like enzyme
MKPERPTFAAVVERRHRLAGRAILEKHNPYFVPVDRLQANVERSQIPYTSFAHYDYLGLSRHPEVVGGAVRALHGFGSGVGASRLVGGERSIHQAFENDLADFIGMEATLTLVSGYLSNVTLINHVMGKPDLVLIDDLAHNSIFIGATSGRFNHLTFAHNDLDDLERKLAEHRGKFRHVLVVVEGLYSMDGDIPDLPRLMDIKTRHDSWLMLDEAHSYGVLGATGRGICEHFGIDPAGVELSIGTLSKSFVSAGGFIGASRATIEWLRYTLPGFVYSVGLPPATLGSAHAALTVLRQDPDRVAALHERSHYFLHRSREAGLNPGSAIGRGVVPILFDTPLQTMQVSETLMSGGVYAPPIVQIGVPKDQPRIRFFISASHTHDEIDRAIDLIADAVHGTAALPLSTAAGS